MTKRQNNQTTTTHNSVIKDFDSTTIELPGEHLIEAGAGTGKTFNIIAIYLRLLLEEKLYPRNILVTTFTEAATKELKERIREAMETALQLLQNRLGDKQHTWEHRPVIEAVYRRERDKGTQLNNLSKHMRISLDQFDQAAIYTIHSFCHRILTEHPLETGRPGRVDMAGELPELHSEILNDFKRNELYHLDPGILHYLLNETKLLPSLAYIARPNRNQILSARTIPDLGDKQQKQELQSYLEKMQRLLSQTSQLHQDMKNTLKQNPIPRGVELIPSEYINNNSKNKATQKMIEAVNYIQSELPWDIPSPSGNSNNENSFCNYLAYPKLQSGRVISNKFKDSFAENHHPVLEKLPNLNDLHKASGQTARKLAALYKRKFISFYQKSLSNRKRLLSQIEYFDLLHLLHQSLHSPSRNALKQRIRSQYGAALIDEFQDTDNLQYEIIKEIFVIPPEQNLVEKAWGRTAQNAGADPGDIPVFFIGDPKQSIYAFRGADIFSYMRAAQDSQSAHTLRENWRSTPELIEAYNKIFSRRHYPFLFEEISYPEAKYPAHKQNNIHKQTYLYLATDRQNPAHSQKISGLRIWPYESSGSKNAMIDIVVPDTARHIAYLLEQGQKGRAYIADNANQNKLQPRDIAVLVRSHKEGSLMQGALKQHNIPTVVNSQDSVFSSQEAQEWAWLLHAALFPSHTGRLALALSTKIFQFSQGQIHDTLHSEEPSAAGSTQDTETEKERSRNKHEDISAREQWKQRRWNLDWIVQLFSQHGELWARQGILSLAYQLLQQSPQFTGRPVKELGERYLTNFLHLAELSHEQAKQKRLTPSQLLQWLQQKQSEAGQEGDELRLESDEEAVRIVTIHKSKGLEYPIVFAPFLWQGNRLDQNKDGVTQAHEDLSLVLDLREDEDNKTADNAKLEDYAERLRLFYVALTRAKLALFLPWGLEGQSFHLSPLFYYLYLEHELIKDKESLDFDFEDTLKSHKNSAQNLGIGPIEQLAEQSSGAVTLNQAPRLLPENSFFQSVALLEQVRSFDREIHSPWYLLSYSALHRYLKRRALFGRPGEHDTMESDQLALSDESNGTLENSDSNDQRFASEPSYFDPADQAQATEDYSVDNHLTTSSESARLATQETELAPILPPGPKSGNLIHGVLERLPDSISGLANADQISQDNDYQDILFRSLRRFGFLDQFDPMIESQIENPHDSPAYRELDHLVTTTLTKRLKCRPSSEDKQTFAVGEIPLGEQIRELEFHFGQDAAGRPSWTGQVIQDFAHRWGLEMRELPPLPPLHGFLTGAIDLIARSHGRYYIIDWKSNFLGNKIHNYHEDALLWAIMDHHYFLQYTIYTMALHRYLSLRLPGYNYSEHFGGIYYLFVRGLSTTQEDHDYGVFYDYIPEKTINRLNTIVR